MLNFGTIGSSWIVDEYINGAKDSELWKLTAVYSRTNDRGTEYAKKHGAEYVFTDVAEMAKSEVIDAVYIASPNSLHFEHCKIMLENGKHVICEKPLCAQTEKVIELNKIAKENNVIFLEAIMFMHLPQRKLLENAISKIGPVCMAKIDFCQRSSKLDSYNSGVIPNIFNPSLETGSLMDLGVYCIYPAIHLFGVPDSFSGEAVILDTGADVSGVITMKYPDKLVTLAYSKAGQAAANTDIQGNDGTIYVESISRLANIHINYTDGHIEEICGDEKKFKLMGYEAKDFYRYITRPEESKTEYEYCTDLNVKVARFMEQARKKLSIVFESDKI